ncbi:hypothetical protein, partial [Klebsiella pneumoniae]|uniref:hypothetical protein n=1 Tax=Klebsiella pneumoniae TaxID=573 RepID=UPI00194F775B
MDVIESIDCVVLILSFFVSFSCKQVRSVEYWVINAHGFCAEDEVWVFIVGIEDGWFFMIVSVFCNG